MATVSISREELMAKLLEAKAKADKEDARITKKHEQHEAAALKKFRDELREAMSWDYAKAKKNSFEAKLGWKDHPSCPKRQATPIEVAIAELKADSRKGRFNISPHSDWYQAAFWLPASERPKESVCD